jgi:Zn finger protein HypA/HybF involved in hydrogenase expression
LLEKKDLRQKKAGILCPHCKTPLSITEPGTYRCPHCHQVFTVRKKP